MAAEAFVLERDTQHHLIIATVRDFWSPATADAYVEAMGTMMAQDRRSFGRAKVLVDRRLSVVQSSETVERLRLGAAKICQSADRMAIVIDSTLLKAQLLRSYDRTTVKLFFSIEDAHAWLATEIDPIPN